MAYEKNFFMACLTSVKRGYGEVLGNSNVFFQRNFHLAGQIPMESSRSVEFGYIISAGETLEKDFTTFEFRRNWLDECKACMQI